ncbi:MAG: cob(I)yrinic acid a,c-diamide adenosyltransferase [Candidatus Muiribacteriota bacterium]
MPKKSDKLRTMDKKQGYIQIYTGDGKGKTTAALGLALRASGAGLRVFIAQFVKGMTYSELFSIKKLPGVKLQQFGRDCFIHKEPDKKDIEAAKKGFEKVKKILKSGNYDIVILDEANIALYYNLFTEDELIEAINNRFAGVEVIVTGRKAPQKLIDMADLVTEMKEIKHYYTKGVEARKGIEN